tara:strand:+ start:120 stop:341 length:222 start_codon:yes stop_codon:yes gene_type:complete
MKIIYIIKTLPATDTKGTRIKITEAESQLSWAIPYNYKFNNSKDVALDYLENERGRKADFYHTIGNETIIIFK